MVTSVFIFKDQIIYYPNLNATLCSELIYYSISNLEKYFATTSSLKIS